MKAKRENEKKKHSPFSESLMMQINMEQLQYLFYLIVYAAHTGMHNKWQRKIAE